MKKNSPVLVLILLLLAFNGLSQEIKLPEERITGEDIRIEKTRIFPLPIPSFKVVIPEIQEPEGPYTKEKGLSDKRQKGQEGYIYFALGSYDTMQNILSYHSIGEGVEYLFDLQTLLSGGYRANSERQEIGFNFQRDTSGSKLSLGLTQGSLGLPGPEGHPLNSKRDFLSFNTDFSFLKNDAFTPSISQRFYRIDNSTEVNFSLLNLSIDKSPWRFETGIERQDVFNEGFSSTSFYQSIYARQDRLVLGGTLKAIERYGVRILPSATYNINENITLDIKGRYGIPDLYRDIISDEYKEIDDNYKIAPEEEYKASLAFHKKIKKTYLYLDISPSYVDNSYVWADMDKNGLLEPEPVQYWQTSINLEIQHTLTDYMGWFFKGEKRFLSEEIDYYPEEVFDTGLTGNYRDIKGKVWLSYTGKRRFSGKELGSVPVINAELVFTKKKLLEWGMSVYNITDREYLKVPGYPAEGRSIMSFIRFLF